MLTKDVTLTEPRNVTRGRLCDHVAHASHTRGRRHAHGVLLTEPRHAILVDGVAPMEPRNNEVTFVGDIEHIHTNTKLAKDAPKHEEATLMESRNAMLTADSTVMDERYWQARG